MGWKKKGLDSSKAKQAERGRQFNCLKITGISSVAMEMNASALRKQQSFK
jgi:hypothetical protein